MSDLKTIGTRVVPGLPPTHGIADPQMRAWAEAMTQAWSVRNGGGGPADEQFVRKGDVAAAAEQAVISVITGQSGVGATVGSLPSVQSVIAEVLGSKVVEILRTPIALAAPTQALQSALDKVRSSVSSLNTKVDALESTGGDAGALVATEAEARAEGDAANASLTTILQSAIYQSMQMGPNLVQNPGFIVGGGGWPDSAMLPHDYPGIPAGAPSQFVLGSQQRDVVCSPYIRVNQGEVLDATVWVALVDSSPEHADCGLRLITIAADMATPIAYPNVAWAPGGAPANGWRQLSGSFTVPAGVYYVRVDLGIEQTNNQTAVAFAQPVVGRRTGVGYVSMASILSEQTTRANKDNALAQALNTVWSSIGGSDALIQDGALAAVSPAAVSATKWQQVQAAVTDPNTGQVNAASIKQELNAYASKVDSTLDSTYSVKLNANGYAVGFALTATTGAGSAPGTGSSSFAIMADRFSVVSPTNQSVVPFTVDGLGNAVFNGMIYAAGGSFAGSLNAASGTIGALTVAANGYLLGGQTDYNTGTGFFVGYSGGQYKFSIGNPAGPYMLWTGSQLLLSQPTFDSFTASIAGGDINLGDNTTTFGSYPYGYQTYGSRTLTPVGGKAPYNYVWIISNGVESIVQISGGTSASQTVTIAGFGDGTINVARVIGFVTDANGRMTMANFNVRVLHQSSGSGTTIGGGGDSP